jgi:preprotein translocase subunit SecD
VPVAFDQQVVDGRRLPPGMPDDLILTEEDLIEVRASEDEFGEPAVMIELGPEGAQAFDEFAAHNVGRRFAMVLDGVVLSGPVIREASFDGRAQISGGFMPAKVEDLVAILGHGALPTEIQGVSQGHAVDGACP